MFEGHTPQVSDWLAWWLTNVVQEGDRRNTHETYTILVEKHILPRFGQAQMSDISPLDVERWLAERRRYGLSGKSLAMLRSVLSRAYRDAIRYGLTDANPALAALPPRREDFVANPLTPDQARHLLRSAQGGRDYALYAVALALGLRSGEIRGLRWRDIDLTGGEMRVRHQLMWWDGKPSWEPLKGTQRERVLVMPLPVAEALREHRIRQVNERMVAPSWTDHDAVFCEPDGTPYKSRQLLYRFQKHLKAAGLPQRRFHDLRHSAASIMFALGVPLEVISRVLGHADLATTARTYLHMFRDMQADAASRMGAWMAEE